MNLADAEEEAHDLDPAIPLIEELRGEIERLQFENGSLARMYALCEETLRERTGIAELLRSEVAECSAEIERLRAALTEISELDLEGDASVADALQIADEALNP